jgi:oligoribonuclease
MKPKSSHLIWIDLEMTGLNTETDAVIEAACIVTDKHLNVVAEGPALAIYQPESVLERMDAWNTRQHTSSGLIERVRTSSLDEEAAEAEILEFIMQHVPPQKSPMCGNSICQDRRFLARVMPKLEHYFHYRNLDVSSVKILAKHWAPQMAKQYKKDKNNSHQALHDVRESIQELRYYREHFFRFDLPE